MAVMPLRNVVIGASSTLDADRDLPDGVRSQALRRGRQEALTSAANGSPLEDSLGALVRTVVDCFGEGTRAAFYLADDDGTSLRHVVGMPVGYAKAVDGFKIGPASLACGLSAYTGQPVLTTDVRKDERWQSWLWMAEWFDYRGCWSFPLRTPEGKVVGTLAVYARLPRAATREDVSFAEQVTRIASVVVAGKAGHLADLDARA